MLSRRNLIKVLGGAAFAASLPRPLRARGNNLQNTGAAPHKILTCNIRVALPEDEAKGNGWNDRKELCARVIRDQYPDIVCLQEVIRPQPDDLEKSLPGFRSFGFSGPEMDRYREGYHGIAKNPIMFSESRYEMISGGCYWLSETPLLTGSKSWNTARARHVNWVRLRERSSGKEFRVLNTHLDHRAQEAREKQAAVIAEESGQYLPDFPQLLAGDFNASASNTVYGIIRKGNWEDSYTAIHGEAEPGFTVHNFLGENHPRKASRRKIDFIFSRGKIQAVSAAIIKDHEGGRYPSDHYFVSAEVVLSTDAKL